MTKGSGKIDIGELFRDGRAIDAALAAAVQDAIRLHKEKGLPMAVWRDGQTVWIPAAELPELPPKVESPS